MATLSEQARKIMEKNPICTARHCGLPADECILINGKEVPYCRDHAWYWRAYNQDRVVFLKFKKEAEDEK